MRPLVLALVLAASPAAAKWQATDPAVTAAVKDPDIAAVLEQVDRIDAATVSGDTAAFGGLLAEDLVVNNPQNGISQRGATGQRSAAGRITYERYDRRIDYAGRRGALIVLMGNEEVVPKGQKAVVRRRFTDLWRQDGGAWKLTVRQATIVPAE